LRSYDNDQPLQRVFNTLYSDTNLVDWRHWLTLSCKEEYETLSIKRSGLSSVDNLFDKLINEKTDATQYYTRMETLIESTTQEPIVACHTSGTSGDDISTLKWLHMTKELVQQLWAPGMQAIFETSGLDRKSKAAIFVPSRIHYDGLSQIEGKKVIRLYSSEFSQRLVLALIHPTGYLLDEYQNATDLKTITHLLSMEQLDVISAPATTLLKWADRRRLCRGIRQSYKHYSRAGSDSPEIEEIVSTIQKLGFEAAARKLQQRLAGLLMKACAIFGISSLKPDEWNMIRKFMDWRREATRLTNLYVGSEIGPLAANLRAEPTCQRFSEEMSVFPLTVVAIKHRGIVEPISRCKHRRGRLLVSRRSTYHPIFNIDPGDIIQVTSQDGLPRIAGIILREAFPLKSKPKLFLKTSMAEEYTVYVGDYFDLGELEIINPRSILHCLAENRLVQLNQPMVLRPGKEKNTWIWTLKIRSNSHLTAQDIQRQLTCCIPEPSIQSALQKKWLKIEPIEHSPVQTSMPRIALLHEVRQGTRPKGALKKWPLYWIRPHSKE
jgi:hypothetical protein